MPEPKLSTDHWGLRFTDPEVELAYAGWRVEHVLTFTRVAMYAGGIAAAFAWVAVLAGALDETRTTALLLIPVVILMHVFGAWLTHQDRLRAWVLPWCAVDNFFGGVLAITMTISLDNFAVTGGCITMAAYFGMTMFRMPPLLALSAVAPYIVLAIILAISGYASGDVAKGDMIFGIFIAATALMTGFVICLGIERVTRRTYADSRVIEAQRQALFADHSTMARFLSAEVVDNIRRRGIESALRPEMQPVTVVCTDLRGFTAFTEAYGAEAMATVLRSYYEAVIETTAVFGGTVKDFAGDGALVLMGAPLPRPDHARTGLELARGLLAAVTRVTSEFGTGSTPLGIGVGIASGDCAVGAIGSMTRLEYTAVGSAVNLASRLCSVARDGQIVIGPSTARLVEHLPRWTTTEVTVKGFSRPVAAFVEETRVASVERRLVDPPV